MAKLRIGATSWPLIGAICAVLVACASEAPAPQLDELPPPSPALPAPPAVVRTAVAESLDARERSILRALSPRVPLGVEGMRRIGTGSGFFIAANQLLTNFHVVASCRAMTVGNNTEGEEVAAKLFASDPQADLAVLSAEEKDIQPAQFRRILRSSVIQNTGWWCCKPSCTASQYFKMTSRKGARATVFSALCAGAIAEDPCSTATARSSVS